MDYHDIEARLQERSEDVCRHLFPNGKRDGAEFVVGSIAGEAGQSFKINLAGKLGLWKDFAGDKGGKSLLSLWMHARQLPKFGHAMGEAKKFLGIPDDFETRVKPFQKTAAAPVDDSAWKEVVEVWGRSQPLTEGGPVWEYLVGVRKLEPQVLAAFGVRELIAYGGWTMVFPYYATADDNEPLVVIEKKEPLPAWLKFEKLDRVDGKKKEWTTRGPEKSLFGVQLLEHPLYRNCRDVLICEGEKDALAWATFGCSAWGILPLSVPFGAKWKGQEKGRPSPNREWLDRQWDWLQNFETVYVQMDSDEAGQRAAADIIAEIGPRRCRLVQLPAKDTV